MEQISVSPSVTWIEKDDYFLITDGMHSVLPADDYPKTMTFILI